MNKMRELINSVYPSLQELYVTGFQDEKKELRALIDKAQERMWDVQEQQNNSVKLSVDKNVPCGRLLAEIMLSDEDSVLYILNHAYSDYRRIAVLNDKGIGDLEQIEVLRKTLMLLDIVDSKRDTLLDVEHLCEVVDAPSKRYMIEQLRALEELLGIIALCTDEANALELHRLWHEEQELRWVEWRNRELEPGHDKYVDNENVLQCIILCNDAISSVAQDALMTDKDRVIRVLNQLTEVYTVSGCLEDKRKLVSELLMM